jgi:hypothetical protein
VTDHEFGEGDILGIHNGTYEVEQVDVTPSGHVIQYRLEALSGPPGTLKPHGKDDAYTFVEYHEVEDIEVKGDD